RGDDDGDGAIQLNGELPSLVDIGGDIGGCSTDLSGLVVVHECRQDKAEKDSDDRHDCRELSEAPSCEAREEDPDRTHRFHGLIRQQEGRHQAAPLASVEKPPQVPGQDGWAPEKAYRPPKSEKRTKGHRVLAAFGPRRQEGYGDGTPAEYPKQNAQEHELPAEEGSH